MRLLLPLAKADYAPRRSLTTRTVARIPTMPPLKPNVFRFCSFLTVFIPYRGADGMHMVSFVFPESFPFIFGFQTGAGNSSALED
jgi:hypothetical protein